MQMRLPVFRRKSFFFSSFFFFFTLFNFTAGAQSLQLYAPYSRISVTPGQTINYSIKVINNSKNTLKANIYLIGLPKTWTHTLKAGGWEISRISVLPGETQTLSLQVVVPLKVKKGYYRFHVKAEGNDDLPLTINVSESGTYKTAFTTKQSNLEGAANTSFTFNGSLKNATADTQYYALNSRAPRGWQVDFKASYKQVASVKVDPNQTQSITIEVHPPDQAAAGTYKIPVEASSSNTSAGFILEVVITGSYKISLSTPTGRLSTDITAGHDKKVELAVQNTGSAPLKDISMSSSTPADWTVSFSPKKIDALAPGQTTKVMATIHADKDAIAGDYVTDMTAKTASASSKAAFRVSVKTSALWGWVGILIIVVAIGVIYLLFKKYGRR